jgi:hypothetical protein
MSPGRGRRLRSRRMSLTRFCSCRWHCRLSFHMRNRHESERDCSRYGWRRARIGAGCLVRSVIRRLLSRGVRCYWFPIGKLRRSCILYDRCRRRLVCGQPRIGKLTGLKHVAKAEPEEAAYGHADRKIACDRYPSFFRLRIPGRAHGPTASMAGALEWRDPCSASEQKEVSCFCGLP